MVEAGIDRCQSEELEDEEHKVCCGVGETL
jgi:hypothetical protein